jgi:hypothetical protein
MSKNYLAYGMPMVQQYQYGTGYYVDAEPLFYGTNNPKIERQGYFSGLSIKEAVALYAEAGREIKECIDLLMAEEDINIAEAWKECQEAIESATQTIDQTQAAIQEIQQIGQPDQGRGRLQDPVSKIKEQRQGRIQDTYTQQPYQPNYEDDLPYMPTYESGSSGYDEDDYKRTRNIILSLVGVGGLYLFLTRKKRK